MFGVGGSGLVAGRGENEVAGSGSRGEVTAVVGKVGQREIHETGGRWK